MAAGAACWLAWWEVTGALEHVPGFSQDQHWHPLMQTGAMVTAFFSALALARATRSLLAPIGVGAGLWLAHTVWAAQQDSPLWGAASLLALTTAMAVTGLALSVFYAWGLLQSASVRA